MTTVYILKTTFCTVLIFLAASYNVFAFNTAEPLVLRKIMFDMGKNMQTITDGISREDWTKVEKAALQVAEHPKPPIFESIKIMSFVGSNVSTFKDYDNKTHNAALALGKAAVEKDGYKVISAFATLQNTCLACHQSFRKSFLEHFYN